MAANLILDFYSRYLAAAEGCFKDRQSRNGTVERALCLAVKLGGGLLDAAALVRKADGFGEALKRLERVLALPAHLPNQFRDDTHGVLGGLQLQQLACRVARERRN